MLFRSEVYMEISNIEDVRSLIDKLTNAFHAKNIEVRPPRTGIMGNVGLEASINLNRDNSKLDIVKKINNFDGIIFAMETK